MKKALDHLRKSDPVLRDIIARVGPYRQQYAEPNFTSLARSIVFQQLNGRAASTIFGRLEAGCGECGVTAAAIAKMRMPKLRTFGLSIQKSTYIKDLAKRTASGAIDFASLAEMADEEVIATLTEVKGIGVWTAHMFLIFALRRPDVLPVGDYGIRAAIKKAYALEEMPKPAEVARIAEPWRPYASIAAWYLWRSLDGPAAM
jgi:DNA-3-methyladenine glycosylase II